MKTVWYVKKIILYIGVLHMCVCVCMWCVPTRSYCPVWNAVHVMNPILKIAFVKFVLLIGGAASHPCSQQDDEIVVCVEKYKHFFSLFEVISLTKRLHSISRVILISHNSIVWYLVDIGHEQIWFRLLLYLFDIEIKIIQILVTNYE